MILNTEGTLRGTFSLGKHLDKVAIRTNNGILEGKDNSGNFISILSITDDRLSSNVPLLNTTNTFSYANIFPQVGIGSSSFDVNNPESLLVMSPDGATNTPQHVTGNQDDFLQVLCQNTSNSVSASSDFVAQADNGSPTANYIDMGINSSNYMANYVGVADDGYLYCDGANLNVGAVSGGSNIVFFTNGSDSYANEKMRIGYDGLVTCQNNIVVPDGTTVHHAATVGQLNTKQAYLGNISGIVKGNGSGTYSSASAGTDYLTPTGNGSGLTGLTKTQVSLGNVTNDAQLKASQLSTATDLGGLTPSDAIVSSEKAIKTYVDTGLSGKLSTIAGLNISQLNNDSNYISTLALSGLTDVSIALPIDGEVLKYNGSHWYNGSLATPTSAGAGVDFFPVDVDSDISGYESLDSSPSAGTETIETSICNNNKVLIDSYATDSAGLNRTTIDAGVWQFMLWGYCSATDHSNLVVDMYKRTAGGTETLLFSATSIPLLSTLDLYNITSVQPSFSINTTDRLVMKVSGQTTRTSDTTIYFYNQGTQHYSYCKTPLILRHNDTAEIQGGMTNQYYHLTSAQVGNLNNQSGTNTGDETQATIETKLGAASTSTAGYLTSANWNTFNGKQNYLGNISGIVKGNGSGTYSSASAGTDYLTPTGSGASLTGITYTQVGALSATDSTVTKQGNTFNGVSQLVQTNSSGKLTALDGSNLTGLTSTQVGLSNVPNVDCTNATNISSGTLNNSRLSSSVTLQGNTFNGVSQLMQTNGSGYIPGLNGSLITNIGATQITGTNTAFNVNFETSTANIKMNGAVSVGSLGTVARADHVHATDTSRLSTALTSAYIFVGNGSGIAAGVAMSSDATISNTGALTIANNAITNAKAAQMGANTYKGNATGSTANASDIATNTAFNVNFETNAANIKPDSTAASVGTLSTVARADHVHATESYTSVTGVRATNAGTQSITQNVATMVTFPTDSQDNLSEFSGNTFTSKSAQTVLISTYIEYTANTISSSTLLTLFIYKNGAQLYKMNTWVPFKGLAYPPSMHLAFPVVMAVGDTLNIYTIHNDNAARTLDGQQVVSIVAL